MLKRWVLAAFAFLMHASALLAEPVWVVDAEQSSLEFVVNIGGSEVTGGFAAWTADIVLEPTEPQNAELTVNIDMTSVSIADPRATAVTQPAWLNVSEFPTARYTAQGFDWSEDGMLIVVGTLELRGVSQPLTLMGTLAIDGAQGVAAVSGTILRLDHEVGLGQDAAAPNVVVRARIVARR